MIELACRCVCLEHDLYNDDDDDALGHVGQNYDLIPATMSVCICYHDNANIIITALRFRLQLRSL